MNSTSSPSQEFARHVVATLVDAGFVAYWAGGCVRDQLLGRQPKDYDVATSASPDEVREVFGFQRTLPIGQSFGVITVLGPKSSDPIEVATFRREAGYSDGRHPDEVSFTDAREDALRRDFTINGMFYDPLEGVIHDFVGGQADLKRGIVRAIGDPVARIHEDKLRMLRAVRFAATFHFDLEEECLQTIVEHAEQIRVVSAERITAECRRMFAHPNRFAAIDMLRKSGLLGVILPESPLALAPQADSEKIAQAIKLLPSSASFAETFTLLLNGTPAGVTRRSVFEVVQRWKLANSDRDAILSLTAALPLVTAADPASWPSVQRCLASSDPQVTLRVAESLCRASDLSLGGITFCREKLQQPRELWDPPPLLDGVQLLEMGAEEGPRIGQLLKMLRDAQLLGDVSDTAAARVWVQSTFGDG
jgi:poly(A) polymerase